MSELKALFLRPPSLRLAVAESVTCGQVQAQIGAISGASEFFVGGITAYKIDQKVRHLGVDRASAEPVDCVSARAAAEMAAGACRLFNADIAISTTGYAEPSLARKVAEPFILWGLCHRKPTGTVTKDGRLDFAGLGRVEVQTRAAAAVLQILEQYLETFRRS